MDATQSIGRFAFGKNWQSFASLADEERIAEAQRGPLSFSRTTSLPERECWTRVVAAALRLGVGHVHGVDVDAESVEAARHILSKFAAEARWSLQTTDHLPSQKYDIVYSWGAFCITPARCGAPSTM
jgi:hypothetical protein